MLYNDFLKSIENNKNTAPIIFRFDDVKMIDSYIEELEHSDSISKIIDHSEIQKKEFEDVYGAPHEVEYVWIFFPWSKILIKMLDEKYFYPLRTTRNQLLVTTEEQERFYHFSVGIAGLSVGNSVANALIVHGGGKNVKIIDSDIIAVSNLNRIRTSIFSVGKKKVDITAQEMYEANPYIHIDAIDDVLTEKNVFDFFHYPKKLDIMVDEMDNIKMKILIRLEAKKYGIPVIMITDAEDAIIIDVERYDISKEYPLFHGLLDDADIDKILHTKQLTKEQYIEIGKKLVGIDNISERMLLSLEKIGTELQSVPQLATASLSTGPAAARVIRRIANREESESYRKILE